MDWILILPCFRLIPTFPKLPAVDQSSRFGPQKKNKRKSQLLSSSIFFRSSSYCITKNEFVVAESGFHDEHVERESNLGGQNECSLTVMTFNLLEDQAEGSPNSWEKRRDLCVNVITSYSPVILCTQQGVKSQLEYLEQCLQGYDQFGISRKGSEDDSDEHCAIFYDKEKVDLSEGGQKVEPSGCRSLPQFLEVCLGGLKFHALQHGPFQLKGVEQPCFSFQIVNTNMDELSPRARRRSALLTWQHIASLPPSLPVVYCGGFNTQKESTTGRFLLGRSREHGVVGDMRDAWPNARSRKNVSLIRTYHGFKGDKQGAIEFLKLIFRALCLCWDRQTQDLHVDWILFRGRSLIPILSEVVNNHIDGFYPSSHYPVFTEFMLPRTVRLLEAPAQEGS